MHLHHGRGAPLTAAPLVQIMIIPRDQELGDDQAGRHGGLARDREGQHSIRINQQWRICFSWSDAGPEDVEIDNIRPLDAAS